MKDDLLQKAKIEAAKNKISLTAFIEEAVAQKLNSGNQANRSVDDFNIITFQGDGVRSGVDLNNNASVLDLLEG
jgi:pyruvate/2-oxoglutarate dehydrogenase complex dihydrolipoamide acyltransferase (E2) component